MKHTKTEWNILKCRIYQNPKNCIEKWMCVKKQIKECISWNNKYIVLRKKNCKIQT